MERFQTEFGRSRLYPFAMLAMTVFLALNGWEGFGGDLSPALEVVHMVAGAVMVVLFVGELAAFAARAGPYRGRGRPAAS